jgi:hypothetical protein
LKKGNVSNNTKENEMDKISGVSKRIKMARVPVHRPINMCLLKVKKSPKRKVNQMC